MLKINKKVEYALMLLKYLRDHEIKSHGNNPKLFSAREICDDLNIPFDTVAKVMQSLNLDGVLSSVKGIKGGYALARPLHKISYMDLVHTVEGKDLSLGVCETTKGKCDMIGTCNIVGPVVALNQHMGLFLERLDLETLLYKKVSSDTLDIEKVFNLNNNSIELIQSPGQIN